MYHSHPASPLRFTIGLFLAVTILVGGEDAAFTTYRLEGAGGAQYLTLDASHAVAQDVDGTYIWAMRVVVGKGGTLTQYQWGVPGPCHLNREKDAVLVTLADGATIRFVRLAAPPPAIGWQPYRLPANTVGAKANAIRAEELHRQVGELQRLNEAYRTKVTAAGFSGDLANLPETKACQQQQVAMRSWLRATLQKEGWIAASSGPQVAADLATLAPNLWDFRLLSTLRAGVEAELASGGFPEREAVAIFDGCAQLLEDPLPYGSQPQLRPLQAPDGRADMEKVIPVPEDVAAVDKARQRAGLPPLAQASTCRIVRIAADGRQVAETALPQR